MFFNYLKIAFRNFFKYKTFSLINISGLAIGMTCCFLILMWVSDELSFDRFHKNYPDIYRAVVRVKNDNGVTRTIWGPAALGPGLNREMPEVVSYSRILPATQITLNHNETNFNEKILFVDISFFKMFSFPAIEGDLEGVFKEPLELVITEKMAKKYFGTTTDVIGQVLKMSNKWDYKIKAIIKDVPANSHLDFNILAPYTNLQYVGYKDDNWVWNNTITYFQLQPNIPIEAFNKKITSFIQDRMTKFTFKEDLFLQPLGDIYLKSDFGGERSRQGNITHVYILSIIALFILLIACINFMNLSTARSMNRVTEIGIRKVVGAQRTHLIAQFYGESLFLSLAALVIALGMAELLLPSFNNLAGKQMALDLNANWQVFLGIGLITVFTGLIAGSYPAFFLSALKPARILQGSSKKASKGAMLRKVLVVLQFSLSVLLIISTAIVFNQLQYIKNKDLGYDKENLMMIPNRTDRRLGGRFRTFRTEIMKNSKVLGVTASSQNPTNMEYATIVFKWRGKNPDDQILIHANSVTVDYLDTMKFKLKEGRGFSELRSTDKRGAIMLNEEAVKVMGFTEPVGEVITAGKYKMKVVGVLKNFHFQPIHKKIEPFIMSTRPIKGGHTIVRIHPDQMAETIGFVKRNWTKFFPKQPFDYHFLDEDYDKLYRADERMGTLLTYFAVLAVFIACLGLFGLASFTTEQRTKEIGIRKVLGASTPGIVMLLGQDFAKLVLIANIIAWPVAYYVMTSWLQDFAYRINISLLLFLLTAVLSIFIALVTVSFQTTKAAMANPVKSLRYD